MTNDNTKKTVVSDLNKDIDMSTLPDNISTDKIAYTATESNVTEIVNRIKPAGEIATKYTDVPVLDVAFSTLAELSTMNVDLLFVG